LIAELIAHLAQFDHSLFRLINSSGANPVFDDFMPFWTDILKIPLISVPLILFITAWAYKQTRIQGTAVVIGAFLAAFLTDTLVDLIKPIAARARPPFADLGFEVLTRGIQHSSFSFPSGHAANFFCFGAFLTFHFPKLRPLVLILGLITMYSRVYCGVHFPLDTVGGALLGWLVGYAAASFTKEHWPFSIH
jgi:undecaprenyl-diphosphatase